MSESEKPRAPARVKSSIEVELYAARRVGEVLKALSLASRARVLKLVAEHNAEEAARLERAEFEKRQLSLGPAIANGKHSPADML